MPPLPPPSLLLVVVGSDIRLGMVFSGADCASKRLSFVLLLVVSRLVLLLVVSRLELLLALLPKHDNGNNNSYDVAK